MKDEPVIGKRDVAWLCSTFETEMCYFFDPFPRLKLNILLQTKQMVRQRKLENQTRWTLSIRPKILKRGQIVLKFLRKGSKQIRKLLNYRIAYHSTENFHSLQEIYGNSNQKFSSNGRRP